MSIYIVPFDEVFEDTKYVSYAPSPMVYAFGKKIISGYRVQDHLIFQDAMDNFRTFHMSTIGVYALITALFSCILYYTNQKSLNTLWNIFSTIIQSQKLKLYYTKSYLLQYSFYLFILLTAIYYKNSVKTSIVINDSVKPINSISDIFHPSYSKLRPYWMSFEEYKMRMIKRQNYQDDYTKLVKRAFEMGINESLASTTMETINRLVNSTVNGETIFIGTKPLLNVLKKQGCIKVKKEKNYIPWISVEEFDTEMRAYLMYQSINRNTRAKIEM